METEAPPGEPAWACVAGVRCGPDRGVARFARGCQALLCAGRKPSLLSGAVETGPDGVDSPRRKEGAFLVIASLSKVGCRG